jgi:hypothetical protein
MVLSMTLVDNRTGHTLWQAQQRFSASPAHRADVTEAIVRMLRTLPLGQQVAK